MEPFELNSTVCLKTAPDRHYKVTAIQLAQPPEPEAPRPMKLMISETQHYYTLERSGKPAYWYHNQLVQV